MLASTLLRPVCAMVDPTGLGNTWGADWEFYACNIFHWLDILNGLGVNLQPPDHQQLTLFVTVILIVEGLLALCFHCWFICL